MPAPQNRAVLQRLLHKRSRTAVALTGDEARAHAVSLWVLIMQLEGTQHGPLAAALESEGGGIASERILAHLEDCFAGRATSTSAERGQSVLLYMRWARTQGVPAFPMIEPTVFHYVRCLFVERAPPLRATVPRSRKLFEARRHVGGRRERALPESQGSNH